MLLKPQLIPQPDPLNKKEMSLFFAIKSLIINLQSILNSGLSFSDNFNAKIVTFTTSATPDAENTVAHGLGKVPTGYIVILLNKAAILYNGSTTWDSTSVYLKSNVASTEFKILVF